MEATRKRTWTIVAIIAAGAVVAAIVIWAVISSGGGRAESSGTPVPTPSGSGSSAAPLPTPTPGATEVVTEAPPAIEVPVDAPATPVDGVTVKIVSMESFEVTTAAPGELAGPALRIVVSVQNATSAPLDIAGAALTLAYGPDAAPASDVGDPVVKGLPNSVPAGETVTGEYSFSVPKDQRGTVRVTLDLLTAEPEILFVGSAP